MISDTPNTIVRLLVTLCVNIFCKDIAFDFRKCCTLKTLTFIHNFYDHAMTISREHGAFLPPDETVIELLWKYLVTRKMQVVYKTNF